MSKTCSIQDCEKPHVALGYCESHYRRFKRHGDPEKGSWWRGLSPEERFWAKTNCGDRDACWLWTGSKKGLAPYQYGSVWDGTYSANGLPHHIGAHRFAYQLLVGEIPDRLEVCHHCDNCLCVNPDHLFLGTHSDNMRDMVNKGRADNRGERNGRSKLSAAQIAEIRSRATGRYGEISEFAREYGIATGTMSKILKHQTWNSHSAEP